MPELLHGQRQGKDSGGGQPSGCHATGFISGAPPGGAGVLPGHPSPCPLTGYSGGGKKMIAV
ncbi:MAG: hypothetical protein ACLUFL_02420 [Flavonifractor plautii]